MRPIDYVDLSCLEAHVGSSRARGEQLEETVFEVLAQNSRPSIKRPGGPGG